MISSILTRNYLFKVSFSSTKISCKNCSRLRMKPLERLQWRHSSVCIVNCEHISNYLLFIDFKQANVSLGNFERINTFENKVWYIMRYIVVI